MELDPPWPDLACCVLYMTEQQCIPRTYTLPQSQFPSFAAVSGSINEQAEWVLMLGAASALGHPAPMCMLRLQA